MPSASDGTSQHEACGSEPGARRIEQSRRSLGPRTTAEGSSLIRNVVLVDSVTMSRGPRE